MASIRKYRQKWLRYHAQYEKRAYNLFRKSFQSFALRMPYAQMTPHNYRKMLDLMVTDGDIERMFFMVYSEIGMIHGNRVGKDINREIKDFNELIFETAFRQGLSDWVIQNAGHSIVTVKRTFIRFIKDIIANGFRDGKTIQEISREIHKLVNRRDFYRWQSMRIARTETTAAANNGAIRAGSSSGIVLDKIWITANDNRVRNIEDGDMFDHEDMHLVKVALNDFFEVPKMGGGFERLPYPGSKRTASGGRSHGSDVINCRCTVAEIPRRDANGRIMRVGDTIIAPVKPSGVNFEKLEEENKTTLPKIRANKVFKNDVDRLEFGETTELDKLIEANIVSHIPIENVNIKDIVPTQRNLNINNLRNVIGADLTNGDDAILFFKNGKYFIIDGHHRIAERILSGDKIIQIRVFR